MRRHVLTGAAKKTAQRTRTRDKERRLCTRARSAEKERRCKREGQEQEGRRRMVIGVVHYYYFHASVLSLYSVSTFFPTIFFPLYPLSLKLFLSLIEFKTIKGIFRFL